MIRKLQIKFVAMCMILVTAVLGVVFTAVFFSAKQNIEVISHQVLQRVMEDDTPSGRPDLGLNRGGEDVLLPYFTVNLWDRSGIYEAFVTGGTYSNLQDTQELQTILTDCLQQNRPEGTIHSYGLRYLRRDYGLYERIAFVDMSMETTMLHRLMRSYFLIVLAALILLLGVSILLSRWATAPVEKAWRQQRQFLSDASHELKTPLASIRLLADSILQSEEMDRETLRDFVSDIGEEADRLTRITEHLLSLTRLDSLPVGATQIVDLAAVARRALSMLAPVADAAQVTVEASLRSGCTLRCTEDDLYQICFNLMENAIKYNLPGGKVFVSVCRDGDQVLLEVADTGIGIPPEAQSRVFERFYRVDKGRARKNGGTGLGLAIVKHIALLHHARIDLQSQVGSGTTIKVTFPKA